MDRPIPATGVRIRKSARAVSPTSRPGYPILAAGLDPTAERRSWRTVTLHPTGPGAHATASIRADRAILSSTSRNSTGVTEWAESQRGRS